MDMHSDMSRTVDLSMLVKEKGDFPRLRCSGCSADTVLSMLSLSPLTTDRVVSCVGWNYSRVTSWECLQCGRSYTTCISISSLQQKERLSLRMRNYVLQTLINQARAIPGMLRDICSTGAASGEASEQLTGFLRQLPRKDG